MDARNTTPIRQDLRELTVAEIKAVAGGKRTLADLGRQIIAEALLETLAAHATIAKTL